MTYIVHDTRVLIFIRSRKGDTLGKRDRAVADDLDLNAVRVKLCTTTRVVFVGDFAFVEPDHLCADEVAEKNINNVPKAPTIISARTSQPSNPLAHACSSSHALP